jgi:amino acid transporter
VAGEIAVIAALAITILVKIGPTHYTAAVLSPASSPNQRLTDLTDAMIYGFTAFAGFEAAAALGEEATNARRSVPVGIVGVVVVTGIFYLLVVCAEAFALGRHGIAALIGQASPLGYLTSRFWSPSVLWSIDLVIVLAGLSFVVAAVNAAIRVMFTMGRERALPGSLGRLSHRRTPVAFRTEFRDEFRLGRHLLIPAAASVVFLFPYGASCSRVPTRWRTCCPSFLSAGS